jgi:hypothetical protein
LWRNTDGAVDVWEMNGFNVADAGVVGGAGSDWSIIADDPGAGTAGATGTSGAFAFGDIANEPRLASAAPTTGGGTNNAAAGGSYILPPGGTSAPLLDLTRPI